MSSTGSSEGFKSDNAQQGSPKGLSSFQESEVASKMELSQIPTAEGLPFQRYIDDYDKRTAILIGLGNSSYNEISSPETSSILKTLESFDRRMYGEKNIEDELKSGLNSPNKPDKDEQINEIVSNHEREREIDVYRALLSGENAPWDIRTGEERTQPPRRGQRRREQRRRLEQRRLEHRQHRRSAQRSSPFFGISSIRDGRQNSNPVNSSPSHLQMPQFTENNPDFHQRIQQVGLQHDLTSLVPSTARTAFENSLPHNWQNGSSNLSEVDTRMNPYLDVYHVPSSTSSAATYQAPSALIQRPVPDVSADIPDISPNARGSYFADELARGAWRESSFRYNDPMTISSGSMQTPLTTPPSSSTLPLRNNESSDSRDSGSSLSPVETSDAAPGMDNRVISVQAQEERSDDDLDWIQDFIHDDMF